MDEHRIAVRLGRAIVAARTEAGLTQEKLAETIGLDRRMLRFYEKAEAVPRLVHVSAMEQAFGLRAGELLVAAGLVDVSLLAPSKKSLAQKSS